MNYVLIPLSIGIPEPLISQMHIVRRSYQQKLIPRNLTPLFISTLFTKEMIDDAYEKASGILLMGGLDINPTLYGQPRDAETKVVNDELDALEFSIAKRAINDKKSLLGICRGMQMINVACGGTLVQHVPSICAVSHDCGGYDTLGDVVTDISMGPDTKLSKITNMTETKVNCGHHQSVDELGKGLRVCAQDKNGIVEAIESTNPRHFMVGLQGHIETQESIFSDKIFDVFAGAVGD
ncbi:gamma-glutamyl-gamma-aminobutyrate hydrolase family protein [bacterium]|uniref:Uncharacterized protein n=2 Tax=Katanobacteria TaxID=422282 RepID=A0A2M7X2G9_UNCKA|nr:gamma-glutamyl-gamma-aminobutyrate hydrolase family protein [bacterium]PIP56764.1 MAG: hypothetical protein COX05_01305 [candidate division WWE3 bacterium CG22_combo_CG10-13_8_21_14_all_39_12]PJA40337.1 MAG: hypothetical protein CO179_02585 [candidate division WWE3 bacterium CG_4_9_14_3_um_filter_39_7]